MPKRIAYDNTKTAVAKITRVRSRQVTREFQWLQSHFLFAPHFCLVRRPTPRLACFSNACSYFVNLIGSGVVVSTSTPDSIH
jgi:transposase